MTDNLGWVGMEVRPTFDGFGRRIESETSRDVAHAGDKAGRSLGSRMGAKASSTLHHHFSETAKYIVAPLVGAFAIEKVGELIGDSIRGAIEDQGAANRAKLIFGPLSKEIGDFSEHAATKYGLADNQARSAAAGFGILFKSAGVAREESAKDSIQFTKLAADLAAFGHTDPEQAFTALQRGLAGSTRGLKPYGILIDSATQQAEALHLGLLKPVTDGAKIHAAQVAVLRDQAAYNDAVKKSGAGSLAAQTAQAALGTAQQALKSDVAGTLPPLTQQQKILANQALILQQTGTQQGYFSKHSKDLAQQQHILAASFDNAKDKLGHGLLPIVTEGVTALNKDLVPAVDRASVWFDHKGSPAIHHFTRELQPLVKSALPALATGFRDAYGFAKKLEPVAKGMLDDFNKLPSWAQKAVLVGGAAGVVGYKTGLLGAGVKAGLRAVRGSTNDNPLTGLVASRAEPVPVYVTNQGFGTPGPGAPSTPTPVGGASKSFFDRFFRAGSESVGSGLRGAGELGALILGPGLHGYAYEQHQNMLAKQRLDAASATTKAALLKPTASELVDQTQKWKALYDQGHKSALLYSTFPKALVTKVETPGFVQSKANVDALVRAFHVAPKDVTTLYRLEGIEKARREYDALQAHMGQHNATVEQQYELATPGARAGSAGRGLTITGGLHIHEPKDYNGLISDLHRRERASSLDGVHRQ